MVHDAIKKNRSMRMGGKWDQAVLNGHGTTPWILPAAIAERISIQSDKPKEAVQFETACYLTADYFLGGNPLNYVWLTGVGHKQPEQIMHHDSEYYPDGQYTLPGVPPYGPRPRCDWFAPMNSTHPHKGDKCYYNNSHDADFALMHGRIYPPYYNEDGKMQWPVHELFFNNYGSPPTNEYTIHQTIAPAAAAYGFLKRDATGTDSLNEAPGINIKIKDDTHNKLLIDATDQDGWIYSIKVYLDNHLIAVSKKNIELITLDFPETIREGNIWVIASDNLGQTSKSNILKIQKKQ
jgi:hypothetical protein